MFFYIVKNIGYGLIKTALQIYTIYTLILCNSVKLFASSAVICKYNKTFENSQYDFVQQQILKDFKHSWKEKQ